MVISSPVIRREMNIVNILIHEEYFIRFDTLDLLIPVPNHCGLLSLNK